MRRKLTLILSAILALGSVQSGSAVTLPTTVITFTPLTKVTYGDPDIALNISENAGVTTTSISTPAVCELKTQRLVKILSAGICKVTASNPGTANYKPARSITRSFTVAKAPNVITISDFDWLSMANPDATISTTQASGITFLTSSSSKICSVDGNKVHAIKVGKCSIRATNSGDPNYLAARSVIKSVTIALTSTVQPPAVQVGPWTIRQQNFDDTNSNNDAGAANSWVANGWYHSGLSFRIAQVPVLSTTTMRYKVTDSKGNPVANKLVNLSVGKRYGGSNAKVSVGNQSTSGSDKSPLDQLTVTGTTDSSGIVSFAITGLDTTARSGLYTQIAAWVTDLAVDTIDITNLEYSLSAGNTGGGGNNGGGTIDNTLYTPSGPIDSLFYQPCSGITLFGQIANIDVDPINGKDTVLAVTRGRSDSPSGIWDYSVLTTLPSGNFTSTNSRTVTVQVYSPAANIPILLRLQNERVNYTKFVQAKAVTTKTNQWETLTFDFSNLAPGSQTFDAQTNYTTLALVVNAGFSSTGQKYYFKNFLFPGAQVRKSSITTTSTSPTLSANPTLGGSYLWSEDFNGVAGSRPNSDSWKYALDWNNFIQGTAPDLVQEDGNGNLAIGMQKCADGSWNGGIIHTLGKTAFLYGKVEARIKIASDPGWFSAFYMFGEDVAHWPTCGEFDIQESGPWTDFGSSATIHGNYAGTKTDWNGGGGFSANAPLNRAQLASDFHVYGLQWTPSTIDFLLDGTVYKSFTKAQVIKDGGTWPFDVPEFIVFSVYPYSASLPNVSAGTVLRGQVLVDWIHYSSYQGYGQVIDR